MYQRITLNNENLTRLLKSVDRFAAEFRAGGRSSFVLFGDTLVHERHLDRDAGLIPKILRLHGKLNRYQLPIVADRITVKTNARIFGFQGRGQRPLTVKILMRHRGATFAERVYGKSLFADIRARRMASMAFSGSRLLRVPEIVEYDRKQAQWLVEEHVQGGVARRQDLARVAPHVDFAAIYAGSTRLKPIARRGGSPLVGWIREVDPDFPLPSDQALAPCSLVHGDLGHSGNILAVADGSLCLIDWELARIAPVAIDLGSLYWRNPDLKPLLVRWLSALDPEGRAVDPNIQLAFGLVRHASEMFRNASGYVSKLMKRQGVDHATARARLAEDKAGLRDYLAFLRAP